MKLVTRHRPVPADYPPPGMKRFRMLVEFEGTAYCGFQRQINGMTIQQRLEEALVETTGVETHVTGSSRTDAGVHARGMCVHFDSSTRIPADKLPFALNTRLPEDIRIREAAIAEPGFHARYSACGKIYSYRMDNSRHRHAIGRQTSVHWPVPMDVECMNREAQALVGTHDFAAFAASGSVVKSTVRTIYKVSVTRSMDVVTLTVLGDGFLYNMVRIIAGTLMEIGSGKREPGAIERAIRTGNRLDLGMTAPASGLTLEAVLYEGEEARIAPFFE